MADLFPVTDDDKIAEIQREIDMRRRVYPHLIAEGKLKSEIAERRIEVFAAILSDYEQRRGG